MEVSTVEQAERTIGRWARAKFCYIIDHEPIVTDNFKSAMRHGRTTIEDIMLDQRLKDHNDQWYIDDYGFYLYASPVLSITGEDFNEDLTESGLLEAITEINEACKSKLI